MSGGPRRRGDAQRRREEPGGAAAGGLGSGSERDRAIAAVAELGMEQGYEQTGEAELARRAGLGPGRLRELFPGGKEECLAAAEEANLLAVVAAVGRTYSADRSEWENVIYGVQAILELMAENPAMAYLGFVVARQGSPQRVRDIYESGQRTLGAMLERGWEYSELGEGPAAAALGVLGGAEALVRREVAEGRAERLPLLLPDCVYAATVAFLGQREAVRLARQAERLLETIPHP